MCIIDLAICLFVCLSMATDGRDMALGLSVPWPFACLSLFAAIPQIPCRAPTPRNIVAQALVRSCFR